VQAERVWRAIGLDGGQQSCYYSYRCYEASTPSIVPRVDVEAVCVGNVGSFRGRNPCPFCVSNGLPIGTMEH